MLQLPNKLRLKRRLSLYLDTFHGYSRTYVYRKPPNPAKTLWSFVTNGLALFCLLLITVSTTPEIQKAISPLVATITTYSPLKVFSPQGTIKETFSFVPGSAPRRFDMVDFQGLNILAFYDVPVNADGTLNMDVDGYQSLYTEEGAALFQRADANGTKALITLTQTYNDDILHLLNDRQVQENLFAAAAQELYNTGAEGIAINFEYTGAVDTAYRNKFTNFAKDMTNYLHSNIEHSLVAVVLPDNVEEKGIYDVKELSAGTDKTLVMAYNFAVPESQSAKITPPVFGFDSADYQKLISKMESVFLSRAAKEKLVIERAWYGNGNNYPLYNTDEVAANRDYSPGNTLHTPLSKNVIERLIADVPYAARDAARKNLPFIADALQRENILNENVLAYALATIQHETANTFEPIDEFKGRKSARRLGYEGGTNYYGRGFIQLTHLRNYQKIGRRIGMNDELVRHPEKASQPDVAAKVLAAYFKDFGIAKLVTEGNFVDARSLINPDYHGYMIAEVAWGFLYALS